MNVQQFLACALCLFFIRMSFPNSQHHVTINPDYAWHLNLPLGGIINGNWHEGWGQRIKKGGEESNHLHYLSNSSSLSFNLAGIITSPYAPSSIHLGQPNVGSSFRNQWRWPDGPVDIDGLNFSHISKGIFQNSKKKIRLIFKKYIKVSIFQKI